MLFGAAVVPPQSWRARESLMPYPAKNQVAVAATAPIREMKSPRTSPVRATMTPATIGMSDPPPVLSPRYDNITDLRDSLPTMRGILPGRAARRPAELEIASGRSRSDTGPADH